MDRTKQQFKNDIIKACDQIMGDIEGCSFESFVEDHKIFNSMILNLIIIGEAATHFSEEIRERNPEIRWTSVIGLRNVIAHEYFEIDPKKIWNTATIHVPELKKQMEDLWLV